MRAAVTVHEPKPPDDPDTPLAFSMEGYYGPAAVRAHSLFLGAGLELGAGGQQVPGRGRRPAARRRSGRAPHRAGAGTPRRLFRQRARRLSRAQATSGWSCRCYHIFGSEELSLLAPAVAERMPAPYVALNAGRRRQRCDVTDGDDGRR